MDPLENTGTAPQPGAVLLSKTSAQSQVCIGLDVGTSGLKAVVMDPTGQVLAQAGREYPILTPQPGWAEQNPQEWLAAAAQVIPECLQQARLQQQQIAAIGLSGQMHTTVCVDADGEVLTPAILWADSRSAAQVEQVYRQVGREQLGAWTRNPLAPGFMLASWLWLREHQPHLARRVRTLLLPKDYLRWQLTGQLGTEPSDASSTLCFDPARSTWSAPLLDACGIDPQLFPPVFPSAQVAGPLRAEIAAHLGLRGGIPVVYGGSDQSMQAVGNRVIQPGTLSVTIGTGGQLFAPQTTPAYDPQLRLHLFHHAAPHLWHLEAATLSAGLSLRWLRDQVFSGHSYQELADLATQAPPGSSGVFFLPYLAGERTPYMDPHLRGAFIGLDLRSGPATMARAVMEGVVFSLRQGFELITAVGGPVQEVVAAGGATRHPLWLQILANMFNRPIRQSQRSEAAATGAAMLAGIGVGWYADLDQACRTVRSESDFVLPDPDLAGQYDQLFTQFQTLPPLLQRLHPPS